MNRKPQLDKERAGCCTGNRDTQTVSRSALRPRVTALWNLGCAPLMIILLVAPSALAQLRGLSDPLRTHGRSAPVNRVASPQAPITYDAATSVIKIPPGFNIRVLNGKPKHSGSLDHSDEDRATVPHWTGKFSYEGVEYKYSMVGTDPAHGSATTVIPTEIISLRLVFSNGIVLDPTTDQYGGVTILQSVINSPIFQPANFSA